jgi:serine/threonine-protein kinase RsbT
MSGPEPEVISSEEVPIGADSDVVRVRQVARAAALAAKLSLVDQTKFVTAASELGRNTLIYGGGGSAVFEVVANERRRGVRGRFVDEGPGIADIELALTDGYTSGHGMGLGLSGSQRLVDEFVLASEPGQGTCVTVLKWGR